MFSGRVPERLASNERGRGGLPNNDNDLVTIGQAPSVGHQTARLVATLQESTSLAFTVE